MQYPGGILVGPSMGSQGGMARNSPDSERWLRATNIQKGLIPSPQTPLLVMHKAEKKYEELGKVTDEEQAKQRQLKAILNKLTPSNFEKLIEQVKAIKIDNAATLTSFISQIFD
jgi:translation initiation factor 4G